ncbi:MAG TPA: hypothetical protein VF490_04385 [Chryseosolibacter sp.]
MKEEVERIQTSLQIDEDIDLHMKSWRVQRVGWGHMVSFLLLAILGLFGNGLLSERTLGKGGTFLTYDRFTRFENDTEMEIEAQSVNGKISVVLPPDFCERFKVEKINPDPSVQKGDNGSTVYEFQASGRAHLTLFLSPRSHGSLRCRVAVNEAEFEIVNFIYP